jgi:hypothetical protein
MPKRRFKLGNEEVTAELIDFEIEREGWNTYILGDGTSLKLKAVLAEVLRVDDHYAPNGDPLYVVNATPIIATAAPEHLKKRE